MPHSGAGYGSVRQHSIFSLRVIMKSSYSILAFLLLNIQLLVYFLLSVPSDSPGLRRPVTHTFERLLWILDLILSAYEGQTGFCFLGCLVGRELLTSAKLVR